MATHFSIFAWESHGQRRLVGSSPQGHIESDMTEQLTLLCTWTSGMGHYQQPAPPSVAAKYCSVPKADTEPFAPPALADLCFVSEQDPGSGSVSSPFSKDRRLLLLPLSPKEDCLCLSLGSKRTSFTLPRISKHLLWERRVWGSESGGFCLWPSCSRASAVCLCCLFQPPHISCPASSLSHEHTAETPREKFARKSKLPLCYCCCSVTKLWARQTSLSPSPGVWANSCPLSRWCHPTISSSVTPFSSWPQSFLAWGSFVSLHQTFRSSWQF